MAAPRLAVGLTIEDEDMTKLVAIARSRTEPASRVERARMLLSYRDDPSFFAVGRLLGVHHQTVQRCIERAAALGPLAGLEDSARPGKAATITPEAKAWLVSVACEKAKHLYKSGFAQSVSVRVRHYEWRRVGSMRPRERRETGQNDLCKARLDQISGMNHALAKPAGAINWGFVETSFGAVYNDGRGQPPLPTRLMAGLAILKHMHNLSGEALCERWAENPYYQLFCGAEFF